ncbi:MAG: hypothetical protein QRY74_03810 [Chlamydia sp.]
MRYEISIALSYVLPKKREFHIGFIGLLSSITISVVIWAVLVFFSITGQFERRWSEKITALLGPIQIAPTSSYFDLPENRIDTLSHQTGFTPRRFTSLEQSPLFSWDSNYDEPIPDDCISVQEASTSGNFERAALLLKKKLEENHIAVSFCETDILQATFHRNRATFSEKSSIQQYIYAVGRNQFSLPSSYGHEIWNRDSIENFLRLFPGKEHQKKEKALLELYRAFPWEVSCQCTSDLEIARALLDTSNIMMVLERKGAISIQEFLALYTITAIHPIKTSIEKPLPLDYIPTIGYPIYIPRQLQQHGITLFSKGSMTRGNALEPSSGIPIIVFGFFDTGALPIGGKICITSSQLVSSMNPAIQKPSGDPLTPSSSFIISSARDNIERSRLLCNRIKQELPEELRSSFTISSYQEYPSTRELFCQLKNEKNIFRLLSCILLTATATHIFSILFILAHTKEKEIAILRAIGASSYSIQAIFIISGLILGLAGALIGALLAQITLFLLPEIIQTLNTLQGHEILQSSLYGHIERTSLNFETLLFCSTITGITSAIAGWAASIKAIRLHISDALRIG